MKYFLDQEFHERMYKPLFGKEHHIIELISIGIVDKNGREYYAVSKEFDLKAAWNKHDVTYVRAGENYRRKVKQYWLRDNVLKPIWKELRDKYLSETNDIYSARMYSRLTVQAFSLKSFRMLVYYYGKSNKKIAEEVKSFCLDNVMKDNGDYSKTITIQGNPEFYGYYADYDWVLFCSLYGRMMDLPKGFPMYCRDLKQTFDEKDIAIKYTGYSKDSGRIGTSLNLKEQKDYPKQENEHNALADAKWNKKLYDFIASF